MKECKRVMHFLKTGNYSGAENVVVTLINEMKKRYCYEGIYVSLSGDIDFVLEKYCIEHAIVVENRVKEYKRVIDMYRPDIIHAHDFGTSVIISQVRSNALKISHLHNNPPWIRQINVRSVAYLWASKKFKSILTVSESVLDEYVFGEFIRKKSRVVGNPVNIIRVKELACLAMEYEESDIIFLGRLSYQKNPMRFLKIVSGCKKMQKDIKAIMIGRGELKSEIENKLKQMGLEKNVKILGFKNNPYGYLKHAKVLCVPSDWEGYGLVIIEAFALGVPVVATPVGGIKKFVTERTGTLSMSLDSLCSEIIRLLTDSEYYKKKSCAAYNRAVQLENMEEYAGQFHEIYQTE